MRIYTALIAVAAISAATIAHAEDIAIQTAHLQLLLGVEEQHVTQLNFGSPIQPPTSAPAPTGKRKPPPPEEFHPSGGNGYIWEPALMLTHADGNTSTDLQFVKRITTKISDDVTETRVDLKDPQYPLFVTLAFKTYHDEDVLEQWTEVRHEENAPILLQRFASASPTFARATDACLTQFNGKYKREVTESEEKLTAGTKILDSKLGTRAQYYLSPSFYLAPHGPATEESGEVFGGTLAWSGSFQLAFEIQTETNRLRTLCGMNPYDSAYRLPAATVFKTPSMLWSYSSAGKGQISRNFHRWARTYGLRDGATPRPVLLNNWEATHTNFDEPKLLSLFDGAKAVGAECFLLDDGWFGSNHPRDNDRAGLGDWQPNAKKLPHGLQAIADAAKSRGIRFGIWIEPEMVNPQSDLFDKHPDWAIQQPHREKLLSRNQLVLDLTRPEVKDFVFHATDDLLTQNPGVTYVKWDCNRYITQPGSTYLPPDAQQNLWIDYNRALIDIMQRLAAAHKDVQMMVCAGGGGRVDYGSLPYFDTFWPSDNTDPVSRIKIQYGFSQFFPAASMADHVTRMGDRPLKFTCDVAMSGMMGIDMDLAKLKPAEVDQVAKAVAAYKTIRDVVAGGDLYRLESPYDGPRTSLMYVSPDQSKAVVYVYQTADAEAKKLTMQGLKPDSFYSLHDVDTPPLTIGEASFGGAQIVKGSALMQGSWSPPTAKTYDSCVLEMSEVRTGGRQ